MDAKTFTDNLAKLRFKGDAVVINAPESLSAEFSKPGFTTSFAVDAPSENTLIFVNSRQELDHVLAADVKHIEYDSMLWIAYPKGSSKLKADINRDSLMLTCLAQGLKSVTLVALDDTWSAMRFRPVDRVGK